MEGGAFWNAVVAALIGAAVGAAGQYVILNKLYAKQRERDFVKTHIEKLEPVVAKRYEATIRVTSALKGFLKATLDWHKSPKEQKPFLSKRVEIERVILTDALERGVNLLGEPPEVLPAAVERTLVEQVSMFHTAAGTIVYKSRQYYEQRDAAIRQGIPYLETWVGQAISDLDEELAKMTTITERLGKFFRELAMR